jgi:hypothetical protein
LVQGLLVTQKSTSFSTFFWKMIHIAIVYEFYLKPGTGFSYPDFCVTQGPSIRKKNY